MDSKPLITCAGDEKLFASLKKGLVENLPKESVEWKRSHMRNPKLVYVTGHFIPFSEDRLPPEGTKNLLGQAFFHIYWTNCQDVDHYKQSVKEGINQWILKLKARKIYDWLIVVVDHSENKKSNKTKLLPRTTVLDKVKSDFPSQGSQRFVFKVPISILLNSPVHQYFPSTFCPEIKTSILREAEDFYRLLG